ncbi:MAG: hypothetical protein QMD92_03835 [bacterium]|nr:hypothetical protein [bacterium]
MESYQNLNNLREIEKIKYQIQQELALTIKSPIMAALFSGLVPGMGQIYAHNFMKGFLWFSFFIALTSLTFGVKKFNLPATSFFNIFVSLSNLFIWLYIIYDAYKTVKLYNIDKINILSYQTLIFLIFIEAILIIILGSIIRAL